MEIETTFSWEKFRKTPVVGIIRGLSEEKIIKIAKAYQEAGLYSLEITMNTPGAANLIKLLHYEFPSLCIGAGTVCSEKDLEIALQAGAQFIVTPIVQERVIVKCVNSGVPVFPGAFTPTEIYTAWNLGASAIKIFPATQLGSQYIKDVLGPLSYIKLLPTGGVTVDNIMEFINAGAIGVGMGGSLFKSKYINDPDPSILVGHLKEVANLVSDRS